jgi:Predicted transcriptional regulators
MTTELPVIPELRLSLPAPATRDAVRFGALVGDPVRAGILSILRDGPHCVCEMAAALGERQNNVSNHLARLREAGLVKASRHGADARWIYYERNEKSITAALAALNAALR